jgi:3-hydroxyisobutyrate dehydrogenase-like beta-hydroxyacid dehydrogenase
MSNVAVIGLGTMGSGMAANLLRAGHAVTIWNRTPGRVGDLVTEGAREAATISDAVAAAEFVMYCLSDDAAVRAVALGEDGIAANVPLDAIVIDLSSIDPETSAEEAAVYAARAVRFLDAPVFGTCGETERGALWVVAGAIERHSKPPAVCSKRSARPSTEWAARATERE